MKKLNLLRTTVFAGSLLLSIASLTCNSSAAPGDVDLSFDPGSGVTGLNGEVRTVAIQPDGEVVFGGSFSAVQGKANGTLDNTFDPGTVPNSSVYSVALQPDGKVLIGGAFTEINGTIRN